MSRRRSVRRLPHTEDETDTTAATDDRGAYLLLLRLDGDRRVKVGRLGAIGFDKGWYVYVGSAMRGLSARIARHQRRGRKKLRWHVDYLRRVADECTAIALASSSRRECEIAAAVGELLQAGPKGFGSSDCRCATHLFYSAADPRRHEGLHRGASRLFVDGRLTVARNAVLPEGEAYG